MTYIDIDALTPRGDEYRYVEIPSFSNYTLGELKKRIDKLIAKHGAKATLLVTIPDGELPEFAVSYTSKETDKEFQERKEKAIKYNDRERGRKLRLYQDLKKEFGE